MAIWNTTLKEMINITYLYDQQAGISKENKMYG